MYNSELTRKYALQAAIDLRDKPETRDNHAGLCSQLTSAVVRLYRQNHGGEVSARWSVVNDFVSDAVLEWPDAKYDAMDFDNQYPVSGFKEFITECETGTIWQNPRRLELLNWLITQLEAPSA